MKGLFQLQNLQHSFSVALLAATLAGGAFGQQAGEPAAQMTQINEVSGELERVMKLLNEQQKAIESLKAIVATQQSRIEKLQAEATPRAGETTVAAGAAGRFGPAQSTPAQATLVPTASVPPKGPSVENGRPKAWYERFSFGGYTQLRHNRLALSNPDLECEQCDRYWGDETNFSLRRARFRLAGDVTERIYMYFQADFASPAGNLHYGQIRDLYFDIALDKKKEFRIRAGQSKIPFGFENLQSSQNRLPLDRADPLNSSFANERDLGMFLYWAPAHIRARFNHLVRSGLKGSGDYGVFGAGFFNGNILNKPELNNNLHYVTRLTYPGQLKNGQFIEAGVQAYTGVYSIPRDQRAPSTPGPRDYSDRRAGASLVVYPQPLGFQAEYTIGTGPRYNPALRRIELGGLQGGYAQVMFMKKAGSMFLIPFTRYQYYSGGKKQELDARNYLVRDVEVGLEWQFSPALELVTQYSRSDRTFEDALRPNNRQKGHAVRMQLQVNY
jgi:hypothetical protein